jgi:hypothetical protein
MLNPSNGDGRKEFSLIKLLVAVVIAVVLSSPLLPAVQQARTADARFRSTLNLQQLGLSVHMFHDINGRLPSNTGYNFKMPSDPVTAASPGDEKSGSWAWQILPFIEQIDAFKSGNVGFIKTFACPGRGRPTTSSYTDYAWNCFLNTAGLTPQSTEASLTANNPISLLGIIDGTSNTIMIGHKYVPTKNYPTVGVTPDAPIPTGGTISTGRATTTYLKDSDVDDPNGGGKGSWGGPFKSGGLFTMGDGSVRPLPYSFGKFNYALNPSDGQTIKWPAATPKEEEEVEAPTVIEPLTESKPAGDKPRMGPVGWAAVFAGAALFAALVVFGILYVLRSKRGN